MSAARRLHRALATSARAAGCIMRVTGATERPWSSATFVGTLHRIVLETTPSDEATAWIGALAGAELPVAGHTIAECRVERAAGGACLHVLTLEA